MGSRDIIKAQKEKTSQELIEAALQLAAEEGYASLSLRSVARKAGIAPTSFYRHFRDIDEMGVAIIDKAILILKACLAEALTQMKPRPLLAIPLAEQAAAIDADIVRPFVQVFLQSMDQHPQLMHLFFQERTGSSAALRRAAADGMARLQDILGSALAPIFQPPDPGDHAIAPKAPAPHGQNPIEWLADSLLTLTAADTLKMALLGNRTTEALPAPLVHKLNSIFIGEIVRYPMNPGENHA